MGTLKDLTAYKKAFNNAMRIFEMAQSFPAIEQFALTSQIIRSSRSVCVNLAEGYRKRQYKAHFLSKVSDADSENTETLIWLDFALHCNYIDASVHENLCKACEEVGKLLNHMLIHPDKYIGSIKK